MNKDSVTFWGILIATLYPVLAILLSEINHRLKRADHPSAQTVRLLKNVFLPLLTVYLVLVKIIPYEIPVVFLKLYETLLWIIGLYLFINFINQIFFTDSDIEDDRKARVPKLLQQIMRMIVIAIGFAVIASEIWGSDLGSLITALGVTSLVLGLALQDTLGNLFAGISLIYEKPFATGDWIQIDSHYGKIVEINWRAIRIVNRQNDMITVPNSYLGKQVFLNYSRPNKFHAESVRVAFNNEVPPNKVKGIIEEIIQNTANIRKEPPYEVKTVNFDNHKVEYEVLYFIDDFWESELIKDELYTKIWYGAKRNSVKLPNPVSYSKPWPFEEFDKEAFLLSKSKLILNSPVFSGLTVVDLKSMIKKSNYNSYGQGEVIVQQGELSDHVHLIIMGEVAIYVEQDGEERTHVGTAKKGELFGEMELLNNTANEGTVIAHTDLGLMSIPYKVINDLIENNLSIKRKFDSLIKIRKKEQFNKVNN
ncbi:mechanosensitive ion channel domain-containing protein [Reichenbachiella agariperforans]|uniref:Small-conductance mechanosensitive channel n=1 Tax=Reichenbachiella agariperforans TaxID=156994 RepID=A0A1M6KA23_REIAG|nr:mechanosensitive ion channel domain-containing protein [Reichenbachiella agariperforans]MBU2913477.1 mechanosensitive ion channel [Reichenbachiella agariperforans]SHJ55786.1 Small-conductance mechanosensitive channel [Reichenbachiella agariperforans]